MSNKQLAVLVAALVFVFGGPPLAHALSAPLGDLKNCDNITVSSAVLSSKTCMSGFGSSITVQNDSATCIRVGGPTLTVTSGFEVGSGCRDGVGVSLDAKSDIYVMDDGGGTIILEGELLFYGSDRWR